MAGKGKNEVGQALLKIVPDATKFIADLNAKMKAIEGQLPEVTLTVDADTTRARQQIEELSSQRHRVTIDLGVSGEKVVEEKIDRAARDRRATVHVDTDASSLDKMIASMRREHEILSDIAVLKARMGSMDDDAHRDATSRLRALNEELSIRQKLVQAAKASGKAAGGGSSSDLKDLEAAYKALGRESELRRQLWAAERAHQDGLAEQIREQIRLKRELGSIIEEQGESERRDQLASVKRDFQRRALLRDNVQIEKDRAKARDEDDRRALGALRAEQQMRRAEGLDSRGRAGVMMNTSGMTLFNVPNITAAVAGVGSMVAVLGGVVAAAGAAATALGAMGAVVGVGASRVFGAFSDLRSANNSSAGASDAAAANQYKNALERVDDAQQNAADSVKDLRKAQEDLGRAYGQASREIRDQNMELRDAALSQEEAAIGVARAKQRLAQTVADRRAGKASDLDVQEARVGVDRAQLSLKSAQHRFSDQKTDTAVANQKGVAGSDTVKNAKSAVEDQQRRVADSLRDVARAQRELSQASSTNNAGINKFNEAMAKMSPSARSFVNAVRSFGPAWSSLRSQTEEALFKNLGSTFREVASRQLPELQRGFVTLAGTLNGVVEGSVRRVDATFSEFSANGTFDKFLSSVGASFGGFESTIDGVVRALTTLVIEIGPSIGEFFRQFGVFLTEGAGMWGRFGAETVQGLTRMLPLFNRLSAALLPIAETVLPVLERAFGALVKRFESSGGQMNSTVGALGDAFLKLVDAALPLIPPLLLFAKAFAKALSGIPTPVLTGLISMFLVSRTGMKGIIGASNNIERVSKAIGTLQGAPEVFAKMAAKGGILGKTAGLISTSLAGVGKGISALGKGFGLVFSGIAKGARALWLTLAANPIVLLGAAIAALVVGIVWFFTKTETGKKLWDRIWKGITATVSAFMGWLKKNWPLVLAILAGPIGLAVLAFVKNWDKIKRGGAAVLDWLRKNWPLLLAIITGPIGLAVRGIVKHWDSIRSGFGKAIDWLRDKWTKFTSFFAAYPKIMGTLAAKMFSPFKEAAKTVFNAIAKFWNNTIGRISFKAPKWVPKFGGKGWSVPKLPMLASGGPVAGADVAPGGFIVNASATAKNRAVLEKLFPGGGVIRGPGSGTSDSILATAGGRAHAWVSNGEFYVPPEYRALFGLAAGINGGQGVAGLPRYDSGGELDGKAGPGSAYDELGSDQWNNQWIHYYENYTDDGKATVGAIKTHFTNSKGEFKDQDKYYKWRDERFQKWLDESGQRKRYAVGGLPEGVTLESIQAVKNNSDKNAEQVKREEDAKKKWAEKRNQELKEFNDAWFKWFEAHGGDANRDKYLARNPQVNERYRSGQFPPGDDERTVRPAEYDPAYDDSLTGGGDDVPDGGGDGAGSGGGDGSGSGSGDGSGGGSGDGLDIDTDGLDEENNPIAVAANKTVDEGKAKGIDVSIAVTDPDTGQTITAGGTDAMPSASLIKLAVAAAAAKYVKDGKVTLDSIKGNLFPMIQVSSNEDTNALVSAIGGISAVNSAVSSFGIAGSDVTMGRLLGQSGNVSDDPNRMSARGANQLLEVIRKGAKGDSESTIDKATAEETVSAMKQQAVNTKFGAVLPHDGIAHKTGELGGASHDSGYVFDGDRWLEVTVMTNKPGATSQDENNALIQEFAKQVYSNRSVKFGNGNIDQDNSGAAGGGGSGGNVGGAAADRAVDFAQGESGKPYQYGGVGNPSWDCSGFTSGIYAEYVGKDPKSRHFTTESDFEALGFVKGLQDGAFQIGVMRGGGGPNSHMGSTLHNGIAAESGANGVQYGAKAAGADDKQFSLHWSLLPSKWNPPGTATSDDNDYDGSGGGDDLGVGDYGLDGTTGDGSGGTTNTDKGIVESTKLSDAVVNGKFSPKRFAQNVGSKALGYTWDAALEFFGLGNSVLSDDNDYWSLVEGVNAENERLQNAKKQNNKKSNNDGSVGNGSTTSPKNKDLMKGFQDPNENPYMGGGTKQPNLPTAGNLTATSSPEDIAAVIAGESTKRGYKQPTDSVAQIATGMQESGLNPAAVGGGGKWHGIFQQDANYPGRDDPNTNIAGFLDRLDEKTQLDPASDIWERIFWLQQAPSAKTAHAAVESGRSAYLDEIKSKESDAQSMYERVVKKYHTGGFVGGRKEVPAVLLEDEHVTNADSAAEAGPLLSLINSSPANARSVMESLAGPAGAAANVVAPGSGAAVSAAMGAAAGAVEAGMSPVADFFGKSIQLSDAEYRALVNTGRHAPVGEVPVPQSKTDWGGNKVVFTGDMIAYDTEKMVRKLEDSSIAAATGVLGGRGF